MKLSKKIEDFKMLYWPYMKDFDENNFKIRNVRGRRLEINGMPLAYVWWVDEKLDTYYALIEPETGMRCPHRGNNYTRIPYKKIKPLCNEDNFRKAKKDCLERLKKRGIELPINEIKEV